MIYESELAPNNKTAIHWLINSGIQEKDTDSPGYGGFYQSYNARTQRYNFIYSEITGYGISLLCNLFSWTQEPHFLTMAKHAAQYLLTAQFRGENRDIYGAFRYGAGWQGTLKRANEFYSFDNAVCISGMIDIYNLTNDNRYLDAALLAGNWLVKKAQYSDGAFRSMYDLNQRGFDHNKLKNIWYEDRACLNAKNTIGLLKLYAACKKETFKKSATRVGNWVLGLQNPDGSIRVNEKKSYIFTHAHCYATEGLLFLYSMTGAKKYRQAGLSAAEWLLSKLNSRGFLYEDYKRRVLDFNIGRMNARNPAALFNAIVGLVFRRIRSDVVAQSVRIWILLYHLTGEKTYLDASRKALNFLFRLQSTDERDSNANKGLYYCTHEIFGSLRHSSVLPAWSTMFSVHALHMLEAAFNGDDFNISIRGLF